MICRVFEPDKGYPLIPGRLQTGRLVGTGARLLANFAIIAELDDISLARVLVTALRAHGFHPLEDADGGLPGLPGVTGAKGTFAIRVPGPEKADAELLAKALIAEMRG